LPTVPFNNYEADVGSNTYPLLQGLTWPSSNRNTVLPGVPCNINRNYNRRYPKPTSNVA